jgi:putative hemolysin
MDQVTWVNAGLVLLFVLVGGVFAGTELALVSLRESQVAQLEKHGERGRRVAAVARNPNRFLAAVQIGVTVAGFFSAAYGASTLAPDVAPLLQRAGLSEGAAQTSALVLLTLLIAYVSLVLGELVPKRLALQRAAAVSLVVGPPLDRFASLMRPVVWLLSVSTDAVVRLLRGDPGVTSEELTEEELQHLVAGHEGLAEDERKIVSDVFHAADRSLAEVMRPRGEVAFLPAHLTSGEAASLVRDRPYSRYPVTGEDFDDVVGFVHVRDVLGADPDLRIADVVRPILHLPSTNRLLPSLSTLRAQGSHIAVVVDEYGGTDGIITLEDMVEELVGDIRDEYDLPDRAARLEGADGDVDARITIEEFADRTGVALADGPYETTAGFVLARLGRLAAVGDRVPVGDGGEASTGRAGTGVGADATRGAAGHELEVTEVEGRRITRVRVLALEAEPRSAEV